VPVRTARALRVVAPLLAVTAAVGAVVTVYRIGDSGAKAVWNGVVTRSAPTAPEGQVPTRGSSVSMTAYTGESGNGWF
jgi:hypothetical protein